MHTIYLDYAALAPMRKEAGEMMSAYLNTTLGNPSSLHHTGRLAHTILENARLRIAKALEVEGTEILLTSSGTEANNLALMGVARALSAQGKHILVSSIEHPSILETADYLGTCGFDVEKIPVNSYGEVSLEKLSHQIRSDTILISVMHANNEIGTIQPIQAIAEIIDAHQTGSHRPLLHTDACQTAGQVDINPTKLRVDLMTINSTKVGGPSGMGALYVRTGVRLHPHIFGGNQERGLRAGTENVLGAIGFSHALSAAISERESTSHLRIEQRDFLIQSLQKLITGAVLNGHPTNRLPNNVHISIPYVEGESILLMLDALGICVSTGSACSAHNLAPSHVLREIGQSPEYMHGSIRCTLGYGTTYDDVRLFLKSIDSVVKKLTQLSPLPLHI